MERETRFDDIRPYRDEEIPAAMQRIVSDPYFPKVAQFVYPDLTVAEVKEILLGCRNIREFQTTVMKQVNEQVIARTTDGLTYGGVEWLDPSKRYLFISNHRDIVLDSCLLMYILYLNGQSIGEITFGSNLMKGQMVIDIGKSNKMFKVERGGNPRQMYLNSLHLSDYIRYAVTLKKESVWIAQRNGRTKDGIDHTDQGLIKMLGMSGGEDRVKALADLDIVPVSVSYEWESCDILKTLELYASRDGQPYVKKPGEDLNSILTGIMQPKGRVHIEICEPLTADDLNAIPADYADSRFRHAVAEILDKRICGGYRLFPNAYIAYDIRNGGNRYSDRYTKEQYDAFMARMSGLDRYGNDPALRDIFLGIYSNPVCPESEGVI
ncbi:MAG: acyltransferase [Bacteroidaceae bacterium]|nr:acyltransferase [Bacteroidaceae bacterium]